MLVMSVPLSETIALGFAFSSSSALACPRWTRPCRHTSRSPLDLNQWRFQWLPICRRHRTVAPQ